MCHGTHMCNTYVCGDACAMAHMCVTHMYVGVHVPWHTCVIHMCMGGACAMAHMCITHMYVWGCMYHGTHVESEYNFQELVLSFHHGYGTLGVRPAETTCSHGSAFIYLIPCLL